MKALGPLALSWFHSSEPQPMKALGPLAVAAPDILTPYGRSNRAGADDSKNASGPRPFSPPGQQPHGTAQHRRRPHTSPADCAARSAALLIPRAIT